MRLDIPAVTRMLRHDLGHDSQVTSPRSPLQPPPIATTNPFEKAVTEKTASMPRNTNKSSSGGSSVRSKSSHSLEGGGAGMRASHQTSMSVQPLAAGDPALNELMSTTLATTTSKLNQVERQRTRFEEGKASLLHLVDHEENLVKKVQILYDGWEKLPLMRQNESTAESFLINIERFLAQARCDPSISAVRVRQWLDQFTLRLDAQSQRYGYASLHKSIIEEWLVSEGGMAKPIAPKPGERKSVYPQNVPTTAQEERIKWESYVFSAVETDSAAITQYLENLFTCDPIRAKRLSAVKQDVAGLERSLAEDDQFNSRTLNWCVRGLLRSDLLTNEKNAVLTAIQRNPDAMKDLGDDLDMRMKTLDRWAWPSEGVKAEQRKQINSQYRVFHEEPLHDALLLRYIGVKWSVRFFKSLTKFSESQTWIDAPKVMDLQDYHKWQHYTGRAPVTTGVRGIRKQTLKDDYFLSQLLREENEVDRGYDNIAGDDDNDPDLILRKPISDIKVNLLHLLQTEINVSLRLSGATTVLRSDFESFGPSLPHSTIFAVLKFFGVSDLWIQFFRNALEVPMRFDEDGPDAKVRIRRRGTPMSSPLADVFGEVLMFVMDYGVNQRTQGSRLYRLHDDFWFWGSEALCVQAWSTMTDFAKLMGLKFNAGKSGSFRITYKKLNPLDLTLPKGDVRWGWLILNKADGQFTIDQAMVDKHITALQAQLISATSIFTWIHIWNSYAVRFFTSMMGKPANCMGLNHILNILSTFERMQKILFPKAKGNVAVHVKTMLAERFGVDDTPDGFIYYPIQLGGLGLLNPSIPLLLLRKSVLKKPGDLMGPDSFFAQEKEAYDVAKKLYESGKVLKVAGSNFIPKTSDFMSFEEYTEFREETSPQLVKVYKKLLSRPKPEAGFLSEETRTLLGREGDRDKRDESVKDRFSAYELWVIDLYKEEMIQMFGGLCVVEQGLLPMRMVNMARSLRIKWQD